MPKTFFESENYRFALGLENREIFLLRDGKEMWRRNINFDHFDVIGVGNQGHAIVKADEGIALYPPEPHKEEYILPKLDKDTCQAENFTIGKVKLEENGDYISFEKILEKSDTGSKILKFLTASPGGEGNQVLHEVVLYNIKSGKQKIAYKACSERKIANAFSWDISPNFWYLLLAEAHKSGKNEETKFQIADLRTSHIFSQFTLQGIAEWNMIVANEGNILIDAPQKRSKRDILIVDNESNRHIISVSNEFTVAHLSKNYVALESRLNPRFVFKNFKSETIHDIDLSPMLEMDMEYQLFFNQKDNIDLIVCREGQVRVVHSSFERLPVDAKRWEKMAQQRKIDEEIAKKHEVLETKKQDLREKQVQQKVDALLRTALDFKKNREKEKISDLEIMQQKLIDLQKCFSTNLITEEEYLISKAQLERELEALQASKTRIARSYPTRVAKSYPTQEQPDFEEYADIENS